MSQPVHATAVARYASGAWQGVLLRGPSGAGKSDLALRLIDAGAEGGGGHGVTSSGSAAIFASRAASASASVAQNRRRRGSRQMP